MVQRFPSVDPLAETTPSWNPYTYVQNTPINAIDPDGRACVGCPSSRSNEDYNKNGMHKTNTRFEDMFEGDGNRGGIPSPPVDPLNPRYIGNNGGGDPPIRQGDVIPGTGGLVASSGEVIVTASRTYSIIDKLSANRFAHWQSTGTGAGLSVNPNFPQYSAFADDVAQFAWDAISPALMSVAGGGVTFRSSKIIKFSSKLTTVDGFLIKGFTVRTPMNIPVQRFGNMSLNRPDFWGARIGTSQFMNRTFAAIKPSWNPLTQYTRGVIPKGTEIKFGFIGPQGWRYPGGSMQFIVNSRNVVNQSSKILTR